MSTQLWKVLKYCWVLCSIGLLLLVLALYDGTPATQDVELTLLYGMFFLSFPSSQLLAIIFGLIFSFIEINIQKFSIQTSYPLFFIEWLIFFIAGYLQWFMLLPWLRRKWKNRKKHHIM